MYITQFKLIWHIKNYQKILICTEIDIRYRLIKMAHVIERLDKEKKVTIIKFFGLFQIGSFSKTLI